MSDSIPGGKFLVNKRKEISPDQHQAAAKGEMTAHARTHTHTLTHSHIHTFSQPQVNRCVFPYLTTCAPSRVMEAGRGAAIRESVVMEM